VIGSSFIGLETAASLRARGIEVDVVSRDRLPLEHVLGEDMDVLAQHSPVNQLDALKARVMLIVGGDDTRAPPKHSLELRQALRKHQMDPVWLFKPHEGHGFQQEANNVELYTQLMQFLGATIGPGMPSVGGGTATTAAAH